MARLPLGLVVLLCGGCRTSGVRIINCNKNKVQIFEDSPAPVTCGDITSTADVVWRQKNGFMIRKCRATGTCTTALYNDYSLRRSPQSTESQLTLVPDYRRHAGLTVTCWDRLSLSTASCTLVIRRHSVLSECQVTTNTVDGTVSGSCRVQEAFSSDNNYSCSWRLNDGQTFGGFENNRVRVRCSFINAPLPLEDGVYTYTIAVSPPPVAGFSQTVRKDSTRKLSDSTKWIIAGVITTIIIALLLAVNQFITSRYNSTFPGLSYNKNRFERNYPQTNLGEHSSDTGTAADQSTGLSALVSTYDLTSHPVDSRHTDILLRPSVTKESQQYSNITSPSDNHGYEDLHLRNTIEEDAATQLTEANIYENIQTLADETHDPPCTLYEEHQYANLKVEATGEVEVTKRGLPDSEERNSTVYNNVS